MHIIIENFTFSVLTTKSYDDTHMKACGLKWKFYDTDYSYFQLFL